MKRVLLSAGVPDRSRDYPREQEHFDSSQPALIRDAVLAVVREGLRAGFDFVFGAHPSISPMVLTVAREFPASTPHVAVFLSRYFEKVFPRETLELADGVLGTLTVVDHAVGDREASLLTMRQQMVASEGMAGAIVIGGMDGVTDEATMFLRHFQRSLPVYAFGSPGGAALDLFDRPPRGFTADDFCGGSVAPVPRDLLYAPLPGYARVARAIFQAMAPSGG